MYKISVRKQERKITLGRSGRRWEDNNKIDHREIGYCDICWIDQAQDRDK
jgi:hypothetical protein